MVNVLLSVASASNVAFFWIFPFLPISRREMTVVLLIIVLFVMLTVETGTSFIHLVHLLFQLLILLGESVDNRNEGLHLSFQGVRGVFGLLANGSHWSRLLFVSEMAIWLITRSHIWHQLMMQKKISMSWLSTCMPIKYLKNKRVKNLQRALIGCQPKTLRRLSQW